jgi:hypothetical protein
MAKTTWIQDSLFFAAIVLVAILLVVRIRKRKRVKRTVTSIYFPAKFGPKKYDEVYTKLFEFQLLRV